MSFQHMYLLSGGDGRRELWIVHRVATEMGIYGQCRFYLRSQEEIKSLVSGAQTSIYAQIG